jgi:hypothetical protein
MRNCVQSVIWWRDNIVAEVPSGPATLFPQLLSLPVVGSTRVVDVTTSALATSYLASYTPETTIGSLAAYLLAAKLNQASGASAGPTSAMSIAGNVVGSCALKASLSKACRTYSSSVMTNALASIKAYTVGNGGVVAF